VNPRPCVFVDFLVQPDKVDLVKQFPRRSVELYEKDGIIDPIALLGATTPRRSLGLVFSKSSGKKRFEFNADEADQMTPEELAKFILEVVDASPKGQFTQKQMDQNAASTGDQGKDQASTDTPAAPVAEVPAQPAEPVKNEVPTHVPSFGKDCPNKNEDQSETVAMSKSDDKVRLERDELAIKFAKLEAEQAETKKIAEESARKLRRTAREGELKQLMYEGFQLDLVEELDDVAELSDEAYAKHLSRIKSRYQRNPVGKSPIPSKALSMQENRSQKAQEDLSAKAKKYALKHGIVDFKLALEKVQAGAA
jgi:hypothetical protein